MAAPSSHISVRKHDGITRIDFVDRNILDELNIHQIGEELLREVEGEFRPKIVIVFRNVEHMSSAAFGTLMKVRDRVNHRDGQLRLAEIQPRILEAMMMMKLNRLFSIHDSYDAAAQSLS